MSMNSEVVVNGGGGSTSDVWSRGTKRGASDSNLSDFARFEKRLRLLSIRGTDPGQDGKSKHYTPVSHAPAAETANTPSRASHQPSQTQDELMQVDDSRDRVYIHDLDAELADNESEEEKLVFLPDIEKKFTRIPQQVLTGGGQNNQELVLYSVPESLTVSEDHDSVRKAIIESRQRAREKAIEDARRTDMDRQYDQHDYTGPLEIAHGYNTGYEQESDPDAMDVD